MEWLILLLAFALEFLDSWLGMGYGTIASPMLIILGYDPHTVVASILLSQSVAGLISAITHHRLENVNLHPHGGNFRRIIGIVLLGALASAMGAFVSVRVPKNFLKNYIGIIALVMGGVLMSNLKFGISKFRFAVLSLFGAFNKALSGGGFGVIMTSGQIMSGEDAKTAIGVTNSAEALISMVSLPIYFFFNGGVDLAVPFTMTLGAIIAAPLGTRQTKKFDETKTRWFMGLLAASLGVFALL